MSFARILGGLLLLVPFGAGPVHALPSDGYIRGPADCGSETSDPNAGGPPYGGPPGSRWQADRDGPARDTVTLRPGDRAVDGDRIAPYEVVWVQYFEKEGRRTLRRTIVDRVERDSTPDADHLVRTQRFLDPDGSTSSERVNRVERSTLAPVRERWRFGERLTQVDYDGIHVSGAMIDRGGGGPAVRFDERLEEPGFDFNVAPLILSAIHLETGLALRIPHVRIAPPAFSVPELVWAHFRVEGREKVHAGPLGELEAQRVVDPQHDMAFWLIEDPPYLVMVAFPIDESTDSIMELGTVSPLAGGE